MKEYKASVETDEYAIKIDGVFGCLCEDCSKHDSYFFGDVSYKIRGAKKKNVNSVMISRRWVIDQSFHKSIIKNLEEGRNVIIRP